MRRTSRTGRSRRWTSAQRFDTGPIPVPSLAGLEVALRTAPPSRYDDARAITERCRELLSERFDVVTAPGQGTLVTFVPEGDSAETVARLFDAGVVVRDIPETGWVRVSCGYWNTEEHLRAAARRHWASGRCSYAAGTSSTAVRIPPGAARTSSRPIALVSRGPPGRHLPPGATSLVAQSSRTLERHGRLLGKDTLPARPPRPATDGRPPRVPTLVAHGPGERNPRREAALGTGAPPTGSERTPDRVAERAPCLPRSAHS